MDRTPELEELRKKLLQLKLNIALEHDSERKKDLEKEATVVHKKMGTIMLGIEKEKLKDNNKKDVDDKEMEGRKKK